MMERVDVVIIGAGPAGATAAVNLATVGVGCVLLDDNIKAGGQIFRTSPGDGPAPDYPAKDGRGQPLRQALSGDGDLIDHRPDHQVIAIYPGPRVWVLSGEGKVRDIHARAIIVATGALEVPVPVPGWTLPGVYLLGGLQNLIKSAGMVPEGRVILGGAGPLLYLVASQLAGLGVNLTAVVDAAGLPSAGQLLGMVRQPALFWRGVKYSLALARRGVHVYRNSAIVRVEGDARPTEVVIKPLNAKWRDSGGLKRTLPADVVGMSFGLRSNTEITQLAGCEHDYDTSRGDWFPRRNDDLETTAENVFVAGDGGGIAGVEVALAEGEIVAHRVARRLGVENLGELEQKAARAERRVAADRPFHDALAAWSKIRPGIFDLTTKKTVVCRCEDATLGDFAEAFDQGLDAPRPLKMRTRVGMGLCQGRTCSPATRAFIAAQKGEDAGQVPLPTVRVPLRPVPMEAFADLAVEPAEAD
jgi:thioredoxin reductase